MINEQEKLKEIITLIRNTYSKHTWIGEPCQIAKTEDEFCLDIDSLKEFEEFGSLEFIVYDKKVEPEYEISFESTDEVFAQVYTDSKFNIRTIYLNID